METVVYVELTDEGTVVFAPIPAIKLGERIYKLLEHNRPDYESLKFIPGTFVYCLMTKFDNNENLVPLAYSDISEEAVAYILNSQKR